MTPSRPDLSVVVLCYRAEDSARDFVGAMAAGLEARDIDFELVLVANFWPGSGDRTPGIVADMARNSPRLKVVALPKEGDMGWDIRTGFAAASGHHVAVVDGDSQVPCQAVIDVYEKLVADGLDLCKTTRTTRGDGLQRRAVSTVYNVIFHVLFPGIHGHDANSKPKAFTRKALERLKLRSDDWFIDAEIMIQARRLGFRIAEVPTAFLKNPSRGTFVTFRANIVFLVQLLVARLREFREPR